jgi:hypothetical protein
MTAVSPQTNGAGLVQIQSHDEIVRERLAAERQRLELEAGIDRTGVSPFRRPVENAFTRSQRATTTLLFGGLPGSTRS